MATTYKVLGQSAPAATTDTTLYTCPASTQTVISTISVCNRSTSGSFRIAIRPNGASISNQHYIAFDAPIGANDSVFLTIGATIGASDVITVRGSTANLTFTAFGSEIS
jgi:hypothetical protein